jgi:hypothetical protein
MLSMSGEISSSLEPFLRFAWGDRVPNHVLTPGDVAHLLFTAISIKQTKGAVDSQLLSEVDLLLSGFEGLPLSFTCCLTRNLEGGVYFQPVTFDLDHESRVL